MKMMREDTTLTQEQKRDKMKQLHETTHSQINDILTPEQQKKFAELKEQQKAHHEGNQPESKQPY
jgi:Spy/CpxP family protein refolding chaperone